VEDFFRNLSRRLWRSAPHEDLRWDEPVGAVLRVHPRLFDLTRSAFQQTAKRGLECGLFWYGFRRNDKDAGVRAIVVPGQRNSSGHYQIPGWSLEEVADRTRPNGWRNLAQVHTHPSTWIGHSPYDDECANSRRGLSLVFPCYGRKFRDWSTSVGVHEFLNGEWRHLSKRRATERIIIDPSLPVPELIDLRRSRGR
jgi:hypothetical protein